MIVGLDFDNTIVCYDKAIAALGEQTFELPCEVPRTKLGIRDHLRRIGEEDGWTRFQGELYGPGMVHAEPFPHVVETLWALKEAGVELVVISHRTRFPYLGERHDLHAFAKDWVRTRLPGVFSSIAFHETKADKVADIRGTACNYFLDDLPEILADKGFPDETVGVLFAPNGLRGSWSGSFIDSWSALKPLVGLQ